MENHLFDPEIRNTALTKAKIHLMTKPDSVFFTTVLFSLAFKWDESIPTATTNGKYIKFNSEFFLSLNFDERVFLLIHEAMHVAYLHMLRCGDRDKKIWNMAADFVINDQLIQRGFVMPEKGLYAPQFRGMPVEQVYELLLQNSEQSEAPWQDLEISEDGSEETNSAIAKEIDQILIRAQIQSIQAEDKPGTIPDDIKIYLDNLLNPVLPWNQILRNYLNQINRSDYSFKKFNRRFFPQYYIPSLYSKGMEDIAVAIDTSGSVSDEDFHQFITEVHTILKVMQPERIQLVQFDWTIKSVDTVKNTQALMNVQFKGRGGTSIDPVLEWAEQNKPNLLLVFTDGEFYAPAIDTKVPIIWLIHNNPAWNIKYGKVIHYELKQ